MSTAQQYGEALFLAFDWVMLEIEMPEAHREAFLEAALAAADQGAWKAERILSAAWPATARWPSGERHLRSLGWLPDNEAPADHDYDGDSLMHLLNQRFSTVRHRIYRDQQVRELLQAASARPGKRHTHIMINRNAWEPSPCGLGLKVIVSISEGLALMSDPACGRPDCQCTFDPYPV